MRQRFCETLGHDKVPQVTYIYDLRGLRFGYGYEIPGRAGDDWGKVKPGTFVYNVETGIQLLLRA